MSSKFSDRWRCPQICGRVWGSGLLAIGGGWGQVLGANGQELALGATERLHFKGNGFVFKGRVLGDF